MKVIKLSTGKNKEISPEEQEEIKIIERKKNNENVIRTYKLKIKKGK